MYTHLWKHRARIVFNIIKRLSLKVIFFAQRRFILRHTLICQIKLWQMEVIPSCTYLHNISYRKSCNWIQIKVIGMILSHFKYTVIFKYNSSFVFRITYGILASNWYRSQINPLNICLQAEITILDIISCQNRLSA